MEASTGRKRQRLASCQRVMTAYERSQLMGRYEVSGAPPAKRCQWLP
jgi:hypothetical protein